MPSKRLPRSTNILISGPPIPLQRHRHTKDGRSYNPQTQLMDAVSFEVKSQFPRVPYRSPIKVTFKFYFKLKQSRFRSNGDYREIRPDLSNLIKFYEDALNGVLWRDDVLICEIKAFKKYDEYERTEINIISV